MGAESTRRLHYFAEPKFGSEAEFRDAAQCRIPRSQHLENVNVDLYVAKSYRGVSQNTERQRPPFAFQQET